MSAVPGLSWKTLWSACWKEGVTHRSPSSLVGRCFQRLDCSENPAWRAHFFSLRLCDKEGIWRSQIGGQRVVGLVEPFGDGVNLPVLRLGLQPDLCLLPCSVVLATKSRPSSGARIGFMDASMFFTWQACGALSPSHESRRKAGTLCKCLEWASTYPLAHSRSQACSGPLYGTSGVFPMASSSKTGGLPHLPCWHNASWSHSRGWDFPVAQMLVSASSPA